MVAERSKLDIAILFVLAQSCEYETNGAALNRELKQPESYRWESTTSRMVAGEPLVKYLFFCEEAELTEPVRGTTAFASEFTQHGRGTNRADRCETSTSPGDCSGFHAVA